MDEHWISLVQLICTKLLEYEREISEEDIEYIKTNLKIRRHYIFKTFEAIIDRSKKYNIQNYIKDILYKVS